MPCGKIAHRHGKPETSSHSWSSNCCRGAWTSRTCLQQEKQGSSCAETLGKVWPPSSSPPLDLSLCSSCLLLLGQAGKGIQQLVTQRMTPAEDTAAPGHIASRLVLISLSQSWGEEGGHSHCWRRKEAAAEPLQEPGLGLVAGELFLGFPCPWKVLFSPPRVTVVFQVYSILGWFGCHSATLWVKT